MKFQINNISKTSFHTRKHDKSAFSKLACIKSKYCQNLDHNKDNFIKELKVT